MTFIISGFTIMMLIGIITSIVMRMKFNNDPKPYNLFIAHFLFFSLAGLVFFLAIWTDDPTDAMSSDYQAQQIIWAFIFWIISVLCLVSGIYKTKYKE